MFRACLVIPFYRHEHAIGALLDRLEPHGLRCFIVDDGSGGEASRIVAEVAAGRPGWVTLVQLSQNRGKGAAVHVGCEAAFGAGFSHAVQIDADGQHDTDDLPKLVDIACQHPEAVVTGIPVYDDSVPRHRFYGRYVTHVLVWLHTLSLEIVDSMCGFRVYPLEPALALWACEAVGQRMDFDTDIIVRLHWSGVRVISVPTRVTYPTDGVSHYDLIRDNVRFARLHFRLFGGMLRRAPGWMLRRRRAR